MIFHALCSMYWWSQLDCLSWGDSVIVVTWADERCRLCSRKYGQHPGVWFIEVALSTNSSMNSCKFNTCLIPAIQSHALLSWWQHSLFRQFNHLGRGNYNIYTLRWKQDFLYKMRNAHLRFIVTNDSYDKMAVHCWKHCQNGGVVYVNKTISAPKVLQLSESCRDFIVRNKRWCLLHNIFIKYIISRLYNSIVCRFVNGIRSSISSHVILMTVGCVEGHYFTSFRLLTFLVQTWISLIFLRNSSFHSHRLVSWIQKRQQ